MLPCRQRTSIAGHDPTRGKRARRRGGPGACRIARRRLEAFVTERHPFALEPVRALLAGRLREPGGATPQERERALERLRERVVVRLREHWKPAASSKLPETTPGVAAATD